MRASATSVTCDEMMKEGSWGGALTSVKKIFDRNVVL